ncbi:MAG: zinc ribbon domain-containing protein YjdM [Bacillota bacterium]|nr:zinc ribbon domain-containing protein YjdM [Bacillota bacterium]
MATIPNCPKCDSEYTYEDGNFIVCPECGYEWMDEIEDESNTDVLVVRDSNGTVLQSGDTITVIKNLKVKGSSSDLKRGTKVKNIRLVNDADGGHNIECKINGFGGMYLKSEFVKKI